LTDKILYLLCLGGGVLGFFVLLFNEGFILGEDCGTRKGGIDDLGKLRQQF
jgi:hypothetical protein